MGGGEIGVDGGPVSTRKRKSVQVASDDGRHKLFALGVVACLEFKFESNYTMQRTSFSSFSIAKGNISWCNEGMYFWGSSINGLGELHQH